MRLENEFLTESEVNTLTDIYKAVVDIFNAGRPVTLVGIKHLTGIPTAELSDFLPHILTMLDQIENEQKVRQGKN